MHAYTHTVFAYSFVQRLIHTEVKLSERESKVEGDFTFQNVQPKLTNALYHIGHLVVSIV